MSPIVAAAMDTMLYAYFGHVNNDEQLSRLSQDFYSRTMSMLVPAMSPKRQTMSTHSPRDIIASILLIRVYANGRTNEGERTESHFMHLFGAVRFLQACGPTSLDPAVLLDRKLFEELHLQSLLACTAYRRQCPWSQPEWRQVEHYPAPVRPRSAWKAQWFPRLVRVPGLLEKVDSIQRDLRGAVRQKDLLAHCQELVQLRDELEESNSHDLAAGATTISVDDHSAWDLEIEEHCFMTSSSTITTFYHFATNDAAFRFAISSLLVLVSDATVLRILHSDDVLPPLSNLDISTIERHAYDTAMGLCRCMLHYGRIDVIYIINWAVVMLNVAQSLFEEQNARPEVGWCQAAIIATELRLARVKKKSAPDLCRIRDLTAPLVEAVRYLPGHFL